MEKTEPQFKPSDSAEKSNITEPIVPEEKTEAETIYENRFYAALHEFELQEPFYYAQRAGERKNRFIAAKEEILKLGDAGIDILLRGVKEGRINLYRATQIMNFMKSEKAASGFESLLNSEEILNSSDRSASHTILSFLRDKDKPSSISTIVRFAETRLKQLQQTSNQEMISGDIIEQNFRLPLLDLDEAMRCLQRFSDREGFKQAERLYQEYGKILAKINELRTSERSRLKSFLDKPFEVNLEEFPGASPEQTDQINAAIGNYQNDLHWWELPRFSSFGEQAIPLIYQAVKDGRLSGIKAWGAVNHFSTKKILPILHGLLLESAQSGQNFFQRDVLKVLRHTRDLQTDKIIAEFARLSAENALKTEDQARRINFAANVRAALREMRRSGNDESEKIGKLLSFCYPEMCAGYEVVTIPTIERPKSREQREWWHSKTYIRGSAVYAEMLGRGQSKVHDLDIFVTISDHFAMDETMKVGYFEQVDDLEYVLNDEEFAKLKKWIEEHGYQDKKINLVRIPESHLQLEETFENEPKLLLWDQALEGEIETSHYASQDLENYRNGQYYVNPTLPEKLIPRGTLTRALRTLDLGERFGLEYDPTLLYEAEQAARNNKIVISCSPNNRFTERHELNPDTAVDPTFIKVFQDKNLRKKLLRKCPRLGQLAEEIVNAGGIENYIKQNYGEVYVQTRGYVRPFDIKLAKSPVSLERQKQFIEEWYAELSPKDFYLDGVVKLTDTPDLPKPEGIEEAIDKEKLQQSIETRQGINRFLEKAVGRYVLSLESRDPAELKRKIESFLTVMNLDWPTNIEMDKTKVSQTLIKLGVHPRNPILAQFDSKKRHEVELAISADPNDILGASFDKPWHSCVELGEGCNEQSVYEDVAKASVIAYILENNQFIARKMIRAGFTVDKFEPAAAIERLYGDYRYEKAMPDALIDIFKKLGIKTETPMMTYPLNVAYVDSGRKGTERGNYIYYDIYND